MIGSLKLSDIALACQGELVGKDTEIKSVSTDSRSIAMGDLFVALKGDNFDGHEYLQSVVEQGAKALVVNASYDLNEPAITSSGRNNVSVVKVADTLRALGDIAGVNRAKFTAPVVGITGSAGKTTTKEMIAAILMRSGNTLYTQGNFNNEIGVPKTLLSIDDSHQYAVIEMGAARVGDIAYLGQFVKPHISVLTNAAEAHIQGFGSLEGVAKGKSEIYQSLNANGVGVLNIDDDFSQDWLSVIENKKAKVVRVSLNNQNADVYASDIEEKATGSSFTLHLLGQSQRIELSVPGLYNIKNALMASAVANQLNIDCSGIALALSEFSGAVGRMQKTVINNLTVLDDTYNANPKAMKAALDVLSNQKTYKIAILGGMGELGENSDVFHQSVLEHTQKSNIDAVYCFGDTWPKAEESNIANLYENKNALAEKLLSHLSQLLNENKTITVLIKGSRSMKMETFVELLTRTYQQNETGAN